MTKLKKIALGIVLITGAAAAYAGWNFPHSESCSGLNSSFQALCANTKMTAFAADMVKTGGGCQWDASASCNRDGSTWYGAQKYKCTVSGWCSIGTGFPM
jgi:hypothetical protein